MWHNISQITQVAFEPVFVAALAGIVSAFRQMWKQRKLLRAPLFLTALLIWMCSWRIFYQEELSRRYMAGMIILLVLCCTSLLTLDRIRIGKGTLKKTGGVLLTILCVVCVAKSLRITSKLELYQQSAPFLREHFSQGRQPLLLDFTNNNRRFLYYAGWECLDRVKSIPPSNFYNIETQVREAAVLGDRIVFITSDDETNLLRLLKQYFQDHTISKVEFPRPDKKNRTCCLFLVDNRNSKYWGYSPYSQPSPASETLLFTEDFEHAEETNGRIRFENWQYWSSSRAQSKFAQEKKRALSGTGSLYMSSTGILTGRAGKALNLKEQTRYRCSFLFSGLPGTILRLTLRNNGDIRELLRVGCLQEWEPRLAQTEFSVSQSGYGELYLETIHGTAIVDDISLNAIN